MIPRPFSRAIYTISLRSITLLLVLLTTACGTLQVALEPTQTAAPRAGVPPSPTPIFDRPSTDHEVNVIFDERLNLVGYSAVPKESGPGSLLRVTFIWQVLDEISADYNTLVQLLNEQGQILVESDVPTGGGWRHSPDWLINEFIYDQHQLRIPREMSLDEVEIRVGLYDAGSGQRPEATRLESVTLSELVQPTRVPPTLPAALPTATGTAADATPFATIGSAQQADLQQLRVVYVKEGNVWQWDVENGSRQLTTAGGASGVWLSDDGQYVAFLRDQNMWVVDADDGRERQLTRAEDFEVLHLGDYVEMGATGVEPFQVVWRPGSHQILFNTVPNISTYDLSLLDDLWLVDADSGELTQILAQGQGGKFTLSPDGQQLAVSNVGRIDLVAVDGSNRREVMAIPPIRAFDSSEYYATPVWAADSQSLRVAIPPEDNISLPIQPTTLWHIPLDGQAAQAIGHVPAYNTLGIPPQFAPSLDRVAYLVGYEPAADGQVDLFGIAIAELGDGTISDPAIYPAEVYYVRGWSPDGTRLLFESAADSVAEIHVDRAEISSVINREKGRAIYDLAWIDNSGFLYNHQTASHWNLLLGQYSGGDPGLIDSGTNFPLHFDYVWLTEPAVVSADRPPQSLPGIPALDNTIAAILSHDMAAKMERIRLTEIGCTHELGMGGPPKCAADQEEGTPVSYLPILGPGEGQHIMPDALQSVLDFEVEALYAVYRRAEEARVDPAFPSGEYGLIFSMDRDKEFEEKLLVHVDQEGQIVRLDFMIWPLSQLPEREVGEWIVPPAATPSPK